MYSSAASKPKPPHAPGPSRPEWISNEWSLTRSSAQIFDRRARVRRSFPGGHCDLSSSRSALVKQVGLIWHLRDASGKLVVVGAGQGLVDTSTGELLKFAPNFKPDFASVICPALGGAPAIGSIPDL